jgi:agmatinase
VVLFLKDIYDIIQSSFLPPERTRAKASFADIDAAVTFENADAVIVGVPLDITTSFGKGTLKGPESIRAASAFQIETLIYDDRIDIKNVISLFDIGDIIFPETPTGLDNVQYILKYLDENLVGLVSQISKSNKIPIILGGEHTVSYFCFKGIQNKGSMLIHFDAHRDLKSEYKGQKLCHTTPFFRLIDEGFLKGTDLIQIGIRQADELEETYAESNGVITFDAWTVKNDLDDVITRLSKITKDRKIYISFDIDVYDIQYVPCTGTPEPFGLDPFEIIKIIKGINRSADLVGLDIVEVSLRNNDYREGTLATHTLLRILDREFVRTKRSRQ